VAESAKNLNYATEVEQFMDTLFEGQEGFVYCPTKNPKTGHWQTYFFSYPEQRESVVTHIMDASKTKEAYLSPSLFNKPDAKRSAWKGSNYVWVEFDGNAPSKLPEGIPDPSIRVQSSAKGHEHWYWRLDEFESESAVIQGLSKRLTYTLNADKSGWDANQVLRPPGTLHHDSKRRVRLLAARQGYVSLADFTNLVEVPDDAEVQANVNELPNVSDVVQKYKFPTDARDLFNKREQPVGSRSSAMMRMAYHCVEMGMTDSEAYSILLNCDDRWGKFKNRPADSRKKRILGLITHARAEKGIKAELRLSDYEPMYTISELFALDFSKIEWVYDEIVADNSLAVLASDPGVGKTSLTFQMALKVALNQEFIGWQPKMETGLNVGYFQYEMDTRQSGHFLRNMLPGYSVPEQTILNERFRILPTGYAVPLDKPAEQQKLLDYVDRHELKFLFFDSIKAITGLKEDRVESFFNFVNKDLRNDRGCTVMLLHHNRKASQDGRTGEQTLDDLYGDVFISAYASSVVGLRAKANSRIEVASLKSRLAPPFKTFKITRSENQSFERLTIEATEDDSDAPVSSISGHIKL
jgi:hypothetical protein